VAWCYNLLHVKRRSFFELNQLDASFHVRFFQEDGIKMGTSSLNLGLDVLDGFLSDRIFIFDCDDDPIVEHIEHLEGHFVDFAQDEQGPSNESCQS